MKLNLLKRSMLRTIGILMGVLIVLLTGFHFWFVNNAENIIEDLVSSKSNGKLRLQVKNMKFNYFSKRIELEDVVFFSTDTTDQKTTYRFSVDNIRLQAKAILPIVFKKQLRIDSLYLDAPNVEVTRLKPAEKNESKELKDVSVTEEMGRIYNSIQDAIDILEVNRFEFDKGRFTLINKMDTASTPFVITNLQFRIENLQLDSSVSADKVLFSDQIMLRTFNQDIIFPDGLHRLAFSNFRINVRDQKLEFDSCTISGKKSADSRSGFSVFFDTLRLVNLDFRALYQSEFIKADSAYCLNPKFKITIEAKERSEKRELPNIDSLVQQFTGDMQIGYIGVINSDIDITTYKNDVPSTFTSNGNSFEIRGLVIDHHQTKPVSIENFAMAIRDYENFLKDSTYTLRFDSILVRENKILLSNFSVNSEPGRPTRNINVSQFELDGLSWSHLLFNKTLKAREATLYNPRIVYTQVAQRKKKGDRNLFQSLGGLNDIMELDRLRIVNGNIRMNLSNQTSLHLENAYLFVKSQVLLESTRIRNIEQSVEELQFGKAILRIKGLLVELQDAKFTGNSDELSVKYARAHTGRQTINAVARDILLNEIFFNEETGLVNIKGVTWQQARVEVNQNEKKVKPGSQDKMSVHLQNIDFSNTQFLFNGNNFDVTARLDKVKATQITADDKFNVDGLSVSGKDLRMTSNEMRASVSEFDLADQASSRMQSIRFSRSSGGDSIQFTSPAISFTGDINSVMKGISKLDQLHISKPVLSIRSIKKDSVKKMNGFPEAMIGRFTVDRPDITFETIKNDSIRVMTWKGTKNISIENLNSGNDELKIGSFRSDLSGFDFIDYDGEKKTSDSIDVQLHLQNIYLKNSDTLNWSVLMRKANIRNFKMDSVGENKTTISINSADVSDLSLNSEWMNDMLLMLKKNPDVKIDAGSVMLRNQKTDMKLHHFVFDNPSRKASIDSFSFNPVPDRDTYIASHEFQTDYITLKTGRIDLTGLDLETYLKDSSVKMGVLSIDEPYFTTFRDKRPPFRSGIFKPLPTSLLKKIPFPVSIDTIRFNNGTVIYSELNDKTDETGRIPITKMTGRIFPVKNFNISEHDTMRLQVNGYIMDSAWVRLRVRESYNDTLNGFQLTVRMKPTSLTFLNPVLAPLASVKLKSAYLDTLSMRAIGRNDLSLGEMRMYYHDLRVQFLKSGKETKKGLLKGLMTFIANSFVIKKNNNRRVGTVYFPRLQDRSFINYYVKMTMSGVATSIGAKKNRKMLRKYQRELDKRRLPPIDME